MIEQLNIFLFILNGKVNPTDLFFLLFPFVYHSFFLNDLVIRKDFLSILGNFGSFFLAPFDLNTDLNVFNRNFLTAKDKSNTQSACFVFR